MPRGGVAKRLKIDAYGVKVGRATRWGSGWAWRGGGALRMGQPHHVQPQGKRDCNVAVGSTPSVFER